MYRKNIDKIAKCFFIFVLFFNTLFFGVEECFAASLKSNEIGVRDRIRNFPVNVDDRREIKFNFDPASGFTCEMEGLRMYPNFDDKIGDVMSVKDDDSFLEEIGKQAANFVANGLASLGWDLLVGVLIQPFMCAQLTRSAVSALTSKNNKDTISSAINLILGIIGATALEKIQDLILDEDDYNVDIQNFKYCGVYYMTDLVSCSIIAVILSMKSLDWKKRLLITFVISLSSYALKKAISLAKFSSAREIFKDLTICGDDWNVYGNEQIYDNYKGLTNVQPLVFADIKDNYPTKGAFFGSYEYKLNECFENRNQEFCRKLFNVTNNNNLTAATLDGYANILKQPYREYKYGGKEYSYSGCFDPRPDRKFYTGKGIDRTSQLYYFKGSEPANFACDRFLTKASREYREAYKCCIEASQKLICVYNRETEKHTMCKIGSDCTVDTNREIGFTSKDAYESHKITCEDVKSNLEEAFSEPKLGYSKEQQELKVAESYLYICDGDGKLRNGYDSQEDAYFGVNLEKKVVLKIRPSIYTDNKYCVETYNLCPYNFHIMGGTEVYGSRFKPLYETGVKVKYDEKLGKYVKKSDFFDNILGKKTNEINCEFTEDGTMTCSGPCYKKDKISEESVQETFFECYNRASNFCQIDRHCVTINPAFEKTPKETNPYVDTACLNMVGSSHNYDDYSTSINRSNTSIFLTAPLVECVTETAKNVLFNRAGHTRCKNLAEEPDEEGKCPDTGVKYTKGEELDEKNYPAPFYKIRKYILNIIKALMTLAVVLYGYNYMVLGKGFSSPEEVMKFLLKLMFVSYFAISTNWITPIFSGVYTVFNRIALLGIELLDDDPNYDDHKYGGCHFIQSNNINNNYSEYGDRSYIAVFDTLDCKLARYFGIFVGKKTNPPILSILVIGIFSLGVLIIFMLPLIILFMALLYFVINTALSFIIASFTVTILLFISPIMIPLYLFERTRGNFTKWCKVLVANIFSQLFLIMTMFLFFTIFDKYFVGDAVFFGQNEPMRDVYCGRLCKINENEFFYVSTDTDEVTCKEDARGSVVDLSLKSLICILKQTARTSKSSLSILNFIIEDFSGFPTAGKMFISFFTCFIDIMFLMMVVFIFDKFLPYINSLSEAIFESTGSKILKKTLNFTLSDMTGKIAGKIGSHVANNVKKVGKAAWNKALNDYEKRMEKRRLLDGPKSNNNFKSDDKSEPDDKPKPNDNPDSDNNGTNAKFGTGGSGGGNKDSNDNKGSTTMNL